MMTAPFFVALMRRTLLNSLVRAVSCAPGRVMVRHTRAGLLLAWCLLTCGMPAQAQVCTVGSTPVVFGIYDPLTALTTDSTGIITITCLAALSTTVSYAIQLDGGAAASIPNRRMSSGAAQIFYQMYTTSGRATIWGNGTSGSVVVSDSFLLVSTIASIKNYTIYGRIPARQNVVPGTFTDTVMVTLTY